MTAERSGIPHRVDRIAAVFGSPSPIGPYTLAKYARRFGSDWLLDAMPERLKASTILGALEEAAGLLHRGLEWRRLELEKPLPEGYWVEVGPGE